MTHSLQLRFAIALVVFAISSLSRGADSTVQPNDEKPIRALVAAMGEAFAKLDAHAFSMVFHEDADFTNVWGMTAHGRKAIEEFHRPLLEGIVGCVVCSSSQPEISFARLAVSRVQERRGHGTLYQATASDAPPFNL